MKALARLAVVLAIGLAAAAPAGAAKPTASVNPMDASVWEIGPITPNGNRSVNMPPTPRRIPTAGISISRSPTAPPATSII
jgi:hypothetical protein